ncbi:MAG: kelch repeat-containing protein, partial [Polyangiaceae bacterium]
MRLPHPSRAAVVLLVVTVFVGMACLPGHDELSSPRDAVVALPAGRAMLARASARPFVAAGDGFVIRAPSTSLSEGLVTELPRAAHQPVRLAVGERTVTNYREHDRGSRGRLDRGVVSYERAAAGVSSLWLSAGAATEELLVIDEAHAPLSYRLALPAGWSLVAGEHATARVVDGTGRPRLHVTATQAWDADGNPIAVSMTVRRSSFTLELGPVNAWPVVVDPTWLSASAPVQLRQNHTASLMGDGSVWLVGGSNGGPLTSVERFDPTTGVSQQVTTLADPRTGHTATVLPDGRLLVTGGSDGNADLDSTALIDPSTGTVTAGPTMSGPRLEHAAIRLLDGRVLLAGGGTNDVQLFDPSTDTLGAAIPVAFSSNVVTGCRLESGEVLLVAIDGAFRFDPSGDTVTATATPNEPGVFEPIAPVLVPLR